ncbi:MAG TPA: methyltransferase [Candidatus Paceibacterota bacterium]|nr:methyltransferase domain-containing protein [Verrucomicrobiota bacterium]HOX01395.1 methyltransferase [Verrucomicrobiota bacterium]HRZ44084.1 methyltransferase [Candidatus Paceibacterota bacterium]HRZ91584.1 methyltransferase [Candidatus Paceibacterota bacterium]
MNSMWTADQLLELGRCYQPAAVYAAAADLDLFDALASGPLGARELARKLHCDLRGLVALLDALAALGLLNRRGERYALPAGTAELLTSSGSKSIMAMARHQANCMRNWVQLARVVKTGRPAKRAPSVRGAQEDAAAFIEGMHNISIPIAKDVIRGVQPLKFGHLLDVGGASGTWTIAFLRACSRGKATLFDLPHVIPMARRRLKGAGLSRRVRLVAGDFMADPLPRGADLAWVSAIVHQNSRAQNRALFANVFQALEPGGRIAIRDILMESDRTRPVAGALFAINMLVATPGGGTYTFDELREDLESAGFVRAAAARRDPAMNSIVIAEKPDALPKSTK